MILIGYIAITICSAILGYQYAVRRKREKKALRYLSGKTGYESQAMIEAQYNISQEQEKFILCDKDYKKFLKFMGRK